MRFTLAILLFVIAVGVLHATTWSVSDEVDPIIGGTCQGISIGSYGSYIYNWPSKHDGVYWPHTKMMWIWYCNDSGYVSFGHDFDEVSEDERKAIGEFLKRNYVAVDGEMSADRKLWLLEEIYKLRERDTQWWSRFYRIKANLYESLADEARRRALPLLEESVKDLEPGFDLIQAYYVIGDYHRRFGDPAKAKEYWDRAKSVEWIDDEGECLTGSDYINELIEEREELLKDDD